MSRDVKVWPGLQPIRQCWRDSTRIWPAPGCRLCLHPRSALFWWCSLSRIRWSSAAPCWNWRSRDRDWLDVLWIGDPAR